jgi:hypothetical protein
MNWSSVWYPFVMCADKLNICAVAVYDTGLEVLWFPLHRKEHFVYLATKSGIAKMAVIIRADEQIVVSGPIS